MLNKIILPNIIKKNTEYKIHSVFTHVFNIIVEDNIVGVVDNINYLSEMCIYISLPLSHITRQLKVNDKFIVMEDYILIGKSFIKIDILHYNNLKYKQKILLQKSFLEKNIYESILNQSIEGNMNLHQSARSYIFKNELSEAIETINESLEKRILNYKFVGLGYGLTPCIDDYLVGLEFINYILGNSLVYEGFRYIETTEISLQMLKNSKEGIFYKLFYKLIESANLMNDKKLSSVINDILNIGSSSGYYMLLGMYNQLKLGGEYVKIY